MEGTVTISTTEYNNLKEIERGLSKRQVIHLFLKSGLWTFYAAPKSHFAKVLSVEFKEKDDKIKELESANRSLARSCEELEAKYDAIVKQKSKGWFK